MTKKAQEALAAVAHMAILGLQSEARERGWSLRSSFHYRKALQALTAFYGENQPIYEMEMWLDIFDHIAAVPQDMEGV